jgi:hypothetical protein
MTQFKIASLLLAACLAACGGGGGGGGSASMPILPVTAVPPASQAPSAPAAPGPGNAKDCSVALYGDSILHGAYNDAAGERRLAEPPAAALKRLRPAYTVTDHTLSGQSARALSMTFNNATRTAKIVVIESGVIDAWRNDPPVETVKAMAEYARAEGRKVVITGFSRMLVSTRMGVTEAALDRRDEFNLAMKAMASAMGYGFADFGAAAFDDGSVVDQIHPGQTYSLRLVDQLVAALDRAAPGCAQ